MGRSLLLTAALSVVACGSAERPPAAVPPQPIVVATATLPRAEVSVEPPMEEPVKEEAQDAPPKCLSTWDPHLRSRAVTVEQLRQVQVGWTTAQVTALLGPPTECVRSGWSYRAGPRSGPADLFIYDLRGEAVISISRVRIGCYLN